MSTDRRPRIPAELAERIDNMRGEIPFERYVRSRLSEVVGVVHVEPDPDTRNRYRVVSKAEKLEEGESPIIASGLAKATAETHARRVNLASGAFNILDDLVADMERDEDEDLYEAIRSNAEELYHLVDQLADRYDNTTLAEELDRA